MKIWCIKRLIYMYHSYKWNDKSPLYYRESMILTWMKTNSNIMSRLNKEKLNNGHKPAVYLFIIQYQTQLIYLHCIPPPTKVHHFFLNHKCIKSKEFRSTLYIHQNCPWISDRIYKQAPITITHRWYPITSSFC